MVLFLTLVSLLYLITETLFMKEKLYMLPVLFLLYAMNGFAQPTIRTFSPEHGSTGDTVIIYGTHFKAVPSKNMVFFGAARAEITAASQTALTVIVPAGATYEPITVTCDGLTGSSSLPFIKTFAGGDSLFKQSSFAPYIIFPTKGLLNFVLLNDLDNDGKTDIILGSGGLGGNGGIEVFRNMCTPGHIAFAPHKDFKTSSRVYTMAMGDFDGDGRKDVIIDNYDLKKISILRNTSREGSISFYILPTGLTTGADPASARVGDFNADGKPDVAVSNASNDMLSVYLNTTVGKDISFASAVTIHGGLLFCDIDRDNRMDISKTVKDQNYVSVYQNLSTNNNVLFASRKNYTTGLAPHEAKFGEVNNDGRPDMIATDENSDSISVFENISTRGHIAFKAKKDFYAGDAPADVQLNDLNGDGRPEIVVQKTG